MRKHNQRINNPCAVGRSLREGIAMEVLWGVVIARNFSHVENGEALPYKKDQNGLSPLHTSCFVRWAWGTARHKQAEPEHMPQIFSAKHV